MGSALGHPKVTPSSQSLNNNQNGTDHIREDFQIIESNHDMNSTNDKPTSSTISNDSKHRPFKLPPIEHNGNSFVRRKSSIESLINKYGLNDEAIAEYKEAFRLCDRNDDGRITAQELGSLFRSLGQSPSERELENLVDNVDEDGNGTIEFNEFLQMMASRLKEKNENLLSEAFVVFDRNHDGFITPQEIKLAVTSLGEHLTDEELNEMFKVADTNGDGKICFEEFQAVWKMFDQR